MPLERVVIHPAPYPQELRGGTYTMPLIAERNGKPVPDDYADLMMKLGRTSSTFQRAYGFTSTTGW